MVSSGFITTQTPISAALALKGAVESAALASVLRSGSPTASPVPAAAEPITKDRRDGLLGNLFEGSATAYVGDCGFEFRIGRLWFFTQQGSCCHDHAALTVATLGHFVIDPCLLNF
jgi:hypothetical protein